MVVMSLVPLSALQTPANATTTSIALELNSGSYGTPQKVLLGSLASRIWFYKLHFKQLTKSSGGSPYTMTGTDSRSGSTYQYLTRQNYTNTQQLRESYDLTSSGSVSLDVQGSQSTSGSISSRSGVFRLDVQRRHSEPLQEVWPSVLFLPRNLVSSI
jgi:hypothetical protein